VVLVPVIPGGGRAARLAGVLAAVDAGKVPVPEHLHPWVELPRFCD